MSFYRHKDTDGNPTVWLADKYFHFLVYYNHIMVFGSNFLKIFEALTIFISLVIFLAKAAFM